VTERFAAVVAVAHAAAAPPGVDPVRWQRALAEDGYEVLAGLTGVAATLAVCPEDHPDREELSALTWPGTQILAVPSGPTAAVTRAVLTGLADRGAAQGLVVAGDAPDLPPLLLGKLFRELGVADVAVCPAESGELVALAARLPLAPWVLAAEVGLDTPDALDRLARAAPSRRSLNVGPGWHRLRAPGDLSLLDPRLEGWDATRALLHGSP